MIALSATAPQYDWKRKTVSLLGSSWRDTSWIMNAFGFVIPGLLFIVFAIGLAGRLDSLRGRLGSTVLALCGANWVLCGIFSLPGRAHMILALTLTVLGSASFGILARPLERAFGSSRWSYGSWIASFALACGLISPFDESLAGLWQRIEIGVALTWIVTLGVALTRTR